MKVTYLIFAVFLTVIIRTSTSGQVTDEKKLIVRADDIGFSHSANAAIIKAYKEGVLTATELLVPGPWFLEAAAMLKDNPGLDVGVHLCLTAEWDQFKWGPITSAKSLTTEEGYFAADNEKFLSLKPDLVEVENELRAQIKLAQKYIPQVSHLSSHMGTLSSTPELRAIEEKLSKEFNLPLEDAGVNYSDGLWQIPVEDKEQYFANCLDSLRGGVTVIVFHLAFDNEEARSITGPVFDPNIRMAQHRQAETEAVCSDRIKSLIKDKGIKLVTYSGKAKN